MLVQRAISSIVRWQPSHRRLRAILQTLTHGLSIFSTGTMEMKSGRLTRVA
jgi:hypothetical protein